MDEALYARLVNWGRWARQDPDRPDDRCQNAIYSMGKADRDGDGEITEHTVIVMQAATTPELPPIDVDDAMLIDDAVGTLSPWHRILLVRWFVRQLRAPFSREEMWHSARMLNDRLNNYALTLTTATGIC